MAVPALDTRRYQELRDEALARIPIHNPEWTNFNASDPGVTLVELFAFLTESLIYRANQIPERSRRKFLSLLGVPLAPASSARGLVTISNQSGPPDPVTLNRDLEVRAGPVPFRTERGLDVLPVEGRAYLKRRLADQPERLVNYYKHLYASYTGPKPRLVDVQLYETVPLEAESNGMSVQATADGSLWIALLLRERDAPADEEGRRAVLARIRRALAGRKLSVGVVPVVAESRARLGPGGTARRDVAGQLDFQLPRLPPGGALPVEGDRLPQYRSLTISSSVNVLVEPGIVEISLPGEDELGTWTNLDPLEQGVGDFPPSLEDTNLANRVVTWLRVKVAAGTQANLLWVGINATTVSQGARVLVETLPTGTGQPDQAVRLAQTPVIPDSLTLNVRLPTGAVEEWEAIDDLLAAGPEVPAPDPRDPPGTPPPPERPSKVFVLDPASGEIRFGDGARGARPSSGTVIQASYEYGAGRVGNVSPEAIATAPALPAGFRVSNPVRTWGGAEGESVAEGERQAARFLQHRDRSVTREDFVTIVWRTPGVELGRVDVLPAFNPDLAPAATGSAPGAVTLLVVPKNDPLHPDAPEPDRFFLDAICRYLDPRRLVTTEVFLRGPVYVSIWISVGIEVVAGLSAAEVAQAVRQKLLAFLAPVDPYAPAWFEDLATDVAAPLSRRERGWPLGKAVDRLELIAEANRVDGVDFVRGLTVAAGADEPADSIAMTGLELPRVVGISVVPGEPLSLDDVRGATPPSEPEQTFVPVPVIPETC